MSRKTLRITRLPAASVDIGDPGMPGDSAYQITCEITALSDGRWEAEGAYSAGCNQGYYEENHARGPWRGRGDTPRAAIADMVRRADDEYQADMRRAGHDALLECDGMTFKSLASAEADRIERILAKGEREGIRFARIGEEKYFVDAQERQSLRQAAVKLLRKLAGGNNAGGNNALASVSDAELLAELERRGIAVEG